MINGVLLEFCSWWISCCQDHVTPSSTLKWVHKFGICVVNWKNIVMDRTSSTLLCETNYGFQTCLMSAKSKIVKYFSWFLNYSSVHSSYNFCKCPVLFWSWWILDRTQQIVGNYCHNNKRKTLKSRDLSNWWATNERLMSDWWATDEQLISN